jgi:FkbM family methyltransferase
MTQKSSNLFFRGSDTISVAPQLFGSHEPVQTSLIGALSKEGYSDFLIDVGANIGLISCQCGYQFKEVHMYEPNPLCCHILEVNARIAKNSFKYEIHPYGLGGLDRISTLCIPKENWGGAFIRDNNTYSDILLSKKDGFDGIDKKNYFDVDVTLKNSSIELEALFTKLSLRSLKSGVIKIDVEGYEPMVLKGIAESLPKDFEVYILFESWNPSLNLDEIKQLFSGRASIAKLVRHTPYRRSWSKIIKFAALFFQWNIPTRLQPIAENDSLGDIVLKINRA